VEDTPAERTEFTVQVDPIKV